MISIFCSHKAKTGFVLIQFQQFQIVIVISVLFHQSYQINDFFFFFFFFFFQICLRTKWAYSQENLSFGPGKTQAGLLRYSD